MNKSSEPKHIISAAQFSTEHIFNLFKLADDIRANPESYMHSLEGKTVATIFYEPSTRTRLSFTAAVQNLGGKLLSTENANENSSVNKGETIEDTIRVLGRLSNAIIIRHMEDDSAIRAAKVSNVPIINAGAGKAEHPTQSLLDLYTIHKEIKRIDNLKSAFVGDLKYGRTHHSLITMLLNLGNKEMHCVSTPSLALPQKYTDCIASKGAKYFEHYSLDSLPRDVNFIYHSRIQKERLNGDDISKAMFIINKEVLDTFSPNTILMHPLPRNAEISFDVDADPRAVYFKQVENGMYIRMALLHSIFHGK